MELAFWAFCTVMKTECLGDLSDTVPSDFGATRKKQATGSSISERSANPPGLSLTESRLVRRGRSRFPYVWDPI